MPWVLEILPSGPRFFPDGYIKEWEAREHLAPGERVARRVREVTRIIGGNEPAEKLAPYDLPQHIRLKRTPKVLGDLFLIEYGFYIVREPLRALIEELEPGVHQFWPIRVELLQGKFYDVPCYGLNVGCRVKSLLPDQSALIVSGGPEYGGPLYDFKTDYDKPYAKQLDVTLDRSVRGEANIWFETRCIRNPFISDALDAGIRERGLVFWKRQHVNEVI